MTRKSAEIKRLAREILTKHYGTPMAALVVAELVSIVLMIPFSWNITDQSTIREWIIYYVASVIISLVGVVLSAGQLWIALQMSRGREYRLSDLFYAFRHHPDKYILAVILLVVICLIPAIPVFAVAIAAAYIKSVVVLRILAVLALLVMFIGELLIALRYAMIFFVLLDDETMGVRAVFRKSSELMAGNRARFFYIQLSFIGWGLLAMLSLGVGLLWVGPYMVQTQTCFYLDITGEWDERAAAQRQAQADPELNMQQTVQTSSYEDKRSAGFATASIVFGVLALATACCIYSAIICGALAIIFALLSRGGEMKLETKGKLGLILGIIGLVGSILLFAAMLAYTVVSFGSIEELMNYSNQLTEQYMQYYQ